MNDKISLAIETIYDSLTTIWEDNGNIMADAVRDSVMNNLSIITGLSFSDVEKEVEKRIEENQ